MPRKIRYQYPWKAIFLDQDGTLTGKGANTWATPYYKYHEQPECFFDSTTLDVYNGVLCDSTVQIRRVAFYGKTPTANMAGMAMNIIKYDDSIMSPKDVN